MARDKEKQKLAQKKYQEKNKEIISNKRKIKNNLLKTERQKNNNCVLCNTQLFNKIIQAKYCNDCKKIIKKESDIKYSKSQKGKIIQSKIKKQWFIRNKEKAYNINSKIQKLNIEKLSDSYVSYKIIRGTNLSIDTIKQYPELIEVKRLQILTKRLCKTSQN